MGKGTCFLSFLPQELVVCMPHHSEEEEVHTVKMMTVTVQDSHKLCSQAQGGNARSSHDNLNSGSDTFQNDTQAGKE